MKFILPLLFLLNCSHDKEFKLDNAIDVKGRSGNMQLGMDSKKNVILQEETYADHELSSQLMLNSSLREDLSYERSSLQRCRDELADPRLGGHGMAAEIPDASSINKLSKESIGFNEKGEYKIVKKEDFISRLKEERKHEQGLRKNIKQLKSLNRKCLINMRIARMKHGLPPNRYKASGYFSKDGTWITTHDEEKNLGDAFRILSKNKQNN